MKFALLSSVFLLLKYILSYNESPVPIFNKIYTNLTSA